ncbi:hypothetical protein [Pseudomonas sp. nanlin1]|uniref:hypothetical protein n=1 Tax=Pseudomonas sp. nanlin1 TaxID=3040605 RepID=UPI00388E00B1
MLRIRGTIGELPVDLTVEMEAGDWAQLGAQLQVQPAAEAQAKPSGANDALWQAALSVLQAAGQIEGPALLAQLEGLAGSTAAGKRLLVRLRHNPQVRVQSGADAPLYCWLG